MYSSSSSCTSTTSVFPSFSEGQSFSWYSAFPSTFVSAVGVDIMEEVLLIDESEGIWRSARTAETNVGEWERMGEDGDKGDDGDEGDAVGESKG